MSALPGVSEIARRIRNGDVDGKDFVRQALDRASLMDTGSEPVGAFLSLAEPGEVVEESTTTSSAGEDGYLSGVPVAVKDNLCTLDLPTSCGSRILEGYRSPFEATVVRKLREAGGLVIGKTNMDEFAMGSSTENSAFGPTRNPRDRKRVPGGSSGGSAAAVAAGIVPCALGSDTGGSVRQPASFCGVVGIKPTYGRVSRYGLVAYASSLDQVGTFGRTVEDATLLLQAIAGHDPRDATCANRPVPNFMGSRSSDVAGLTIGVPGEYFSDELDPQVRDVCMQALEQLEAAGARVRDVSLPHTRYAVPTYYVLAPAEASSNLARYDGVRFGIRAEGASATEDVYEMTRSQGFGPEVVRRIMLGTFALSAGYYDAYYGRAQRVRSLIARDFEAAWEDGVDIIFTPTSPTPAFRLGARIDDPMSMYLSDIFTVTANLAGIPGISIPVGTVDGLPVGGQFLAPKWEEIRMIHVARVLEERLSLPPFEPAPGEDWESSASLEAGR
jgi:aspartyl-tRNA(Asn)/glutamyl-tRNA(Gln) amidotransferase subunit A